MYKAIIFPVSRKPRRPGVAPVSITLDKQPSLRFASSEDTDRVTAARYSIDDTFGPEVRACAGQVEGAGCGVGIIAARTALIVVCPAGYSECLNRVAGHVAAQL